MQVGIVLGSRSQWSTMQHTAELLANLGVAYEARIITANKNANRLHEYASKAVDRGLEIIIAGSTGAADLREILASKTEITVLGVPIEKSVTQKIPYDSNSYKNMDNLVEMNNAGPEDAVNAALFAASMLAKKHPHIRNKLINYRRQNNDVMAS
ncbi:AIR carboxylase family protein [Pseudomonadota bacterium]